MFLNAPVAKRPGGGLQTRLGGFDSHPVLHFLKGFSPTILNKTQRIIAKYF